MSSDDSGHCTDDTERWERKTNSLGLTDKRCPECDMWSSEDSPCPICGADECDVQTGTDRQEADR